MATSAVRLPTSNPAGNNQTAPMGLTSASKTVSPMPFTSQAQGTNPLMSGTSGATPQALPAQQVGTPLDTSVTPGSLYNSTSSYSSGESNIEKQLIDIYGKGVGGELNSILQGMSGEDSAIFQQWLASMAPVEASETAQLQSTLGSQGVSANSSVSAIANSNLQSQFNAQAAGVDSQLMQQQLQDTIGILQGTQQDAAKEVASSGWGTFADVMSNITGDIGNLMGGSYQSSGSNIAGLGASAPTGMTNTAPYAAVQQSSLPASGDAFTPTWNQGADHVDTSIFNSAPPDVQFQF
jgi:hypothetical protein